jgi:hypothetical protein
MEKIEVIAPAYRKKIREISCKESYEGFRTEIREFSYWQTSLSS